ncbi:MULTISPECIES: APC family permease [Brevibacterium]|uniref:Amino acid/polyamine/organocation transporter, APC superfamily n=2 Tax=Brevibacterium antiquum TaxID=234835 RepID=A0A2H1JY23_9MICO|nr:MULTISPECIES: APC family permease [Brevibacterium]SMX84739.1 amino acid/polyamine/organocation transporter, APC superfamily [Brevibacterium antiquum]SMX92395.1 amino acid/polyamine/organocation transporter, APC superfamily [Brevibacterium antiquum CNRZ 918]HCG56589.1 APC family permease [Brevibacterium sp.]
MSQSESTTKAGSGAEQHPETLKRVMGPKLLLLFIVGDILGTGVYALTGKVAGQVGGAGWAPVILAFTVALITAFSYMELVTKYPTAAGAALYTHKAFGIHFVTFLVAFAVLSSGITSASTASNVFAANMVAGFGWDMSGTGIMWIALGFLVVIAAINLRGVGESVWFNVVLTVIELSGLLLVILVGFFALGSGSADFSRVMIFETAGDKGVFLAITGATSLAFFSMVGFEDSVNMVEETKDPKVFPKIMLTGLSVTGVIYVLVSLVTVAAVPIGKLSESETPLLEVVRAGAPGLPIDVIFPFMTMFAVANSALINMLMASRLLYGMSKQNVLPPIFAKVLRGRRSPWVSILFTTVIACVLIIAVTTLLPETVTASLGGTTSLLLLAVFAVVNVAVLILRKKPVEHQHFKAPTYLPWIGLFTCAFLVGPWARLDDLIQYQIAIALIGIGVVLWAVTWMWNRSVKGASTKFRDPEELT